MNKVFLVGNITRDIELRYTPTGTAVATTGIACSKKFKKQDGSQGEEVMFIDLTFFKRSAEIANQYLAKGSKIAVEGSVKLDQWTDANGGKRSKHSVTVEAMEMLSPKGETQEKRPVPVEAIRDNPMPEFDVNDDEIPF